LALHQESQSHHYLGRAIAGYVDGHHLSPCLPSSPFTIDQRQFIESGPQDIGVPSGAQIIPELRLKTVGDAHSNFNRRNGRDFFGPFWTESRRQRGARNHRSSG
jgi:hypothetical protein